MTRSAMFPLGMVLFPAQMLPLRIFEPRYREMVSDCLRDDQSFGVVLIERGSEVGGGDVRNGLGTLARIIHAQPYPDGRWSSVAIGTERIRVTAWLTDDPYPCAKIESLPDTAATKPIDTLVTHATELLRSVLAMRAELGEAVAPATFDHLNLLAAPGPTERLEQMVALLEDDRSFCQTRLAMEADEDPSD